MSWLSDRLGINIDVNAAIDNAIREKKNAWDNFFASDAGQPFKKIFDGTVDGITAVPTLAGQVAQGKWSETGATFGKIGGAVIQLGLGPVGMLAGTKEGQNFLRRNDFNALTFGLGNDLAGTVRGGQDLSGSGNWASGDRDSLGRFITKGAAIAGAVVVAPSLFASGKAGLQTYGAAQAAARGDFSKIPGATAGVGDDLGVGKDPLGVGELVPSRPDWLPDVNLNPYLPTQGQNRAPSSAPARGTPAPVENEPWSWGGNADSGIAKSVSDNMVPVMVVGVVSLIILKRMKVI